MTDRITAVVVTYNRKLLLDRCLRALSGQTRPPDNILVVDNASTDGTVGFLAENGWLARPDIELLRLAENTGGAGGFSAGVRRAVDGGADWVWLMDDDAEPHVDALEKLHVHLTDPLALYGSVAVQAGRLSWRMMPEGASAGSSIEEVSGLPPVMDVTFIPFLGLAVSRKLVDRIGLPDPGFFIAADDVDYCFRARSAGARVWLIADSRIEHPLSSLSFMRLPGRTFTSLRLPPWKRYYDVRNRMFVARNHYGSAYWYRTIPGQFLRLFVTLLNEPERLRQLHAFMAGMIDGLLGRKGRRHEWWGLRS